MSVCGQCQSGTVQRIVVSGNAPENGVPEIKAIAAEAVCHAPVDDLIGSQQVHGGVVGGRIAARNVAQLGVQELHAETMTIIHENASRVFGGQLWQAAGEAVMRGDHGVDGIPIGDGTGLNAFRNERTHIMGTGVFFAPILRTELAVNVLLLVSEFANVHMSSYKKNRASRGLSGVFGIFSFNGFVPAAVCAATRPAV